MSKLYYLLFVFGSNSKYIYSGFNKHNFMETAFFACFVIFSSPLVLISTAFYKMYHFDTEMAHLCRCAIKPY